MLFFLFFIFTHKSIARDNPFLPHGYKKKPDKETMVNEELDFPKNTLKLKRIVIQYQNIDGTISSKTLVIDKKIDPSKKLLLKQGGKRDNSIILIDPRSRIKTTNPMNRENIMNPFTNIDDSDMEILNVKSKKEKPKELKIKKSLEEKIIESNFKNVKEPPIITHEPTKVDIAKITNTEYIKDLKFYNFLSIALYKNKFFIKSEDKIKQDFELKGRKKIVIDFKRATKNKSKKYSLKTAPYKKVTVGIHKGYYRVVVKLTKYKKYRIKHLENGYIVTLR